MTNKRTPWVLPQIALLAAILASGVYATGCFWLGQRTDWKSSDSESLAVIERSYGSAWLAKAFRPAGWVEQNVRRVEVDVRDNSSFSLIGS
jgi:hypothetical protein